MASITKRKRADGSMAYRAEIRIARNGVIIHSEVKTWSRKSDARTWAAERERELYSPAGLSALSGSKTPIRDIIDQYIADIHSIRPFGRSKIMHLRHL